ncbi:molecular chaperone TorD family protein [Ellagibacter isourolithinifaciens]|uniref:Molecular chaperone TorD family protein n=1 Tax=Ellagibacter isourolithinifaciens TaxID=2137581 RepID=A0A6N6NQW7_9ACTN|nr:molecular chaperone TorD family protein [Ellagibacter isourolithinifaciens]
MEHSGRLRVPARDDVRARYLACGFTLDKDISLPEDHLSFELEFMALLCEHEAS